MRNLKPIQILFVLFIVAVFITGGYVYTTMNIKERLSNMESDKNTRIEQHRFFGLLPQNTLEGLTDNSDSSSNPAKESTPASVPDSSANCPDILVKLGNTLQLYNSRKPAKPGENPILFQNLDEYIQYLETQRQSGIHCPVLFLQHENNAQGEDVYRVRPSPFQLNPGLPITANLSKGPNDTPIPVIDASRENGYNQNNYAGFDPYGLYVGRFTTVDAIGQSTEKAEVSDNPMDPNWGGVQHTQTAVDSGKYDENIVSRNTYPTPKTQFIPLDNPNIPPLPPPVSGKA